MTATRYIKQGSEGVISAATPDWDGNGDDPEQVGIALWAGCGRLVFGFGEIASRPISRISR